MRKQQTSESNAAEKIRAIGAKISGWNAELRETIDNQIVPRERSGVVEINPDDFSYDVDAAAHARLNGAAYVLASTEKKPGIELFLARRKVKELRRAIELAEQQSFTARQDLGRELLAKHDDEIRALHRDRALVLLKLFQINGELEQMRLKLIREGSGTPHPMDGWSQRLFGLANPNTQLNAWPKKYLAECLKQNIITEKDIEA
ncbi:hypothetical protein [Bradyrhizobium sp. JYMT SZCCT0428]|uniref:hypothetical protein n=1 Tax=Bradyrhizobium sp. JYMT SZCCT0428 TaxID=2807673 RepID=UPI001BA5F948|nr:hypothetical protein [Bradyrhizobium sp. JYMT SZCCT0428]MBR1149069.1 hypothetical protein [Bradyrhizobium sp. JYMT SZCCT0428]